MARGKPRLTERIRPAAAAVAVLLALAAGWLGAARAEGPSVRIARPADGEPVSGPCAVLVEVTPHPDVTHVVVYKGDAPLGNDFEPPYRILWDTRFEPDGPARLSAKALGRETVVAESPPITPILDNTPPKTMVIEPLQGATVGDTVVLHAAATDNLAVASVRFLVNGVQLAELAQPPYRAEWDTTRGPNGRFAIEARAFDTAGNDLLSEAIVVRVANPNRPPLLRPIGSQTVAEDHSMTFEIAASDPEAPRDTVTVSVSNLPSWATFNPRTMKVSGVPPPSEASLRRPATAYSNVLVEACDPEPLCTRESLVITVTDVNRPPAMTGPGDRTLKEGQQLSFGLVRSDPDGDTLTCLAEKVPKWLVFDDVRCAFDGTPDFEIANLKEPVTAYPTTRFAVCDPGGLCAKASMTITVRNVDTSPHLDPIGPQAIEEGRLLVVKIRAFDANADLLMLNADPVPEGAQFVDNKDGTGQLTWTPRLDQGGSYEVRITATDGELEVEQLVPITVHQRGLAISGHAWRAQSDDPMPETIIRVFTGSGLVQEVTTDQRGFFLVSDLRPGTYTLRGNYHYVRGFSAQARKLDTVQIVPERVQITLKDADHQGVRFRVYLPE
jgi:hypothetical protein